MRASPASPANWSKESWPELRGDSLSCRLSERSLASRADFPLLLVLLLVLPSGLACCPAALEKRRLARLNPPQHLADVLAESDVSIILQKPGAQPGIVVLVEIRHDGVGDLAR